jgi:chemotaxis protein methyltransferase CheR
LGEFDLILCRNVLMYFDQATAARVGSFLAQSLAPGGWLITSPADPMLVEQTGLEPVTTAACIFYRRAQPARAFQATAEVPKLPDYSVFEPAPVDLFQAKAMMHVQPPAAEDTREQAFHETTTPADADRLDPEFHVLQALRLLDMNSPAAAAASARRALFLNRSVAMAHFALARSLRLLGWHEVARRELRRARAVAGEESQGVQGLRASIDAELTLLERSALK